MKLALLGLATIATTMTADLVAEAENDVAGGKRTLKLRGIASDILEDVSYFHAFIVPFREKWMQVRDIFCL